MGDIKIKNFASGLDTRRSVLETNLGALIELENAHINQGGEIEKRKSWLRTAMPDGTFGLQSIGATMLTFGSDDPTTGSPSINTSLAALPSQFVVAYQHLQHPAVTDGAVTYDVNSHDLEEIVHSTVYGAKAFVLARFSDDQVFAYYDGTIVRDFFAGQVLSYLAGNNVIFAGNLVTLINEQGDFTAAQMTFATTKRERTSNVAKLTFASTTGLVAGQSIKVTGFSGGAAGYNTALATIGVVTSTTVTYANTGSDEALTNDVTGLLTSCLITVTGDKGADFAVSSTEDSTGGSFGSPTVTTAANPGKLGSPAIGTFKITGGRVGGQASAELNIVNPGNASAGDTVTIDGKVYTMKAALSGSFTEGEVKIGATNVETLDNLIAAINHSTGGGAQYYGAAPHPSVSAGPQASYKSSIVANIGGTVGNSIAVSESGAFSWTGGVTALAGGTDSSGTDQIVKVEVVSPTGVREQLIASAVEFVKDVPTTCQAVVTKINADSANYDAYLTGYNEISIYSAATANPQPNSYDIVVTTKGRVCCGECYFYFKPTNMFAWQITALLVDGRDILSTDVSMTGTMAQVYYYMAQYINDATETGLGEVHGYLACPYPTYIQISKKVTSSADSPIFVSPTVNNGTVIFMDTNPIIPINYEDPYTVELSRSNDSMTMTEFKAAVDAGTGPSTMAVASGGTPPYTYRWANAYSFYYLGSLNSGFGRFLQPAMEDVWIQVAGPEAIGGVTQNPDALIATILALDKITPVTRIGYSMWRPQAFDSRTYNLAYRCEVTDSLGVKVFSPVYNLTLLAE